MTLSQFLEATSDTPEDQMRAALVRALAAGAPREHEEYSRLYLRVLNELRGQQDRLAAVPAP